MSNTQSKVLVSKAAKIVGLSVNHFNKKYIKTGLLSVSKNQSGWNMVDLSELARHFPNEVANSSSDQGNAPSHNLESSGDMVIEALKAQLKQAHDQIEELRRDKAWLREQLESVEPKRLGWLPKPLRWLA